MVLTESDRQRWNEFVAACPYGDVLQAWEWGDLKSRTGWEPLRVALREGEDIVAGLQILQRRTPLAGRCLFYAPRGPLVPPDRLALLPDLVAEVRGLAQMRRALALKVDPALETTEAEYARALAACGFRPSSRENSSFGGVQPRYVMKVDISPSEHDLLASFHSKWRYNVRLAGRKGVVITGDCSRADMDVFYSILQQTAERDGFAIRALTYYHDLWDLLVEPGLARLFLGRVEGEVVCGAILFILGPQAWYVYGASSNRHRNFMPNHLLQWEMMRWAKGQGCTVYDMRGVARETGSEQGRTGLHGLNQFKRGFGARYVEYLGEHDLVFSPLWYGAFRAAEPAGRFLRSLRARKRRPQTD